MHKINKIYFSYTIANFYWTTKHHIPEDLLFILNQCSSLSVWKQFHSHTKQLEGQFFCINISVFGWLMGIQRILNWMTASIPQIESVRNVFTHTLGIRPTEVLTAVVVTSSASLCSPPLWSSGQSSWLQIRRPGFDSRHYQKKKVVGLEWGPLNLVSTTEELLDRKVAAPV
jgi:hypothetical protein